MKKEELTKVLKPLIKQCIKEVIFEEGVLSGIITEVVGGLTVAQPVTEHRTKQRIQHPDQVKHKADSAKEAKKKLLESISKDAYGGVDIFENTEPLTKAGTPGDSASPSNPLSSYAPNDPGVNIDGLLSVVGNSWGKLV